MRKLCLPVLFLALSSFCCESQAQKSTPTPIPKPYVWAEWLSEKDNIWLRNFGEVTDGEVVIDIGQQHENNEYSTVPDALILAFKRYQQASKITVRWSFLTFTQEISEDVIYSLKNQRLHNLLLDLPGGGMTYFDGALTFEQMREIAAGRRTFAQVYEENRKAGKQAKK